MDPLLSDLIGSLKNSDRHLDLKKVELAWQFADRAHRGQTRLSGGPYIAHSVQVAKTLGLWHMDTTTVVAGILHDTLIQTGLKRSDLSSEFGEEVAQIVDGVTKITGIRLKGSTDIGFTENLRKMLLVMASDLRVILVKLADRLHNMQTLWALPPESQIENGRETLEIYAPLAQRLGMGEIKGELEDLAFAYVYPEECQQLKKQIEPLMAEGEEYIEKFKRGLLSLIRPEIPGAVINTRAKHLYSLYKKLHRPEIEGDMGKIFDLFAARIIVDTKTQCYQALGLIHEKFHPVPYLGISDFIATPKPNGYQSLHTKVFGPDGRIVELQVRTHEMHHQAEMGIAAHWYYSDLKSRGISDKILEKQGSFVPKEKLDWVKQLAAWQQDIKDNDEYLKSVKFDALQHRLLVFSPKGDVFDLPFGSTPVDFAFAVHTDLGSQANGAKVNAKMVQLDHRLQNGDVVEIILDKKRRYPNRDWLEFVVTSTARREISKTVKN